VAGFDRGLSWLLFAVAMSGCAPQLPYVWARDFRTEAEVLKIAGGDRISVLVKNQAQLSGDFEVRTNGTYVQPLVGEVPVAGLTPEQASTRLAALLKGIVIDPLVAISISVGHNLSVSVIGEVRTPGTLTLPQGEGVLGALARSGGLTDFADESGIYVIRRQPKPIRIRFRYDYLLGGDLPSLEFELRDGDVVVVE
jgi:polysaccharide export outer membrane protein